MGSLTFYHDAFYICSINCYTIDLVTFTADAAFMVSLQKNTIS